MMDKKAPLGLPRGVVRLAAWDPRWPQLFCVEAERIREAVARARLDPLALEHAGSTSVPGLPAKPILDLVAGYAPGMGVQPYMELCVALGYEPRGPQGAIGRELLALGPDSARTHHLSLVEVGGVFWREHLDFRNRLRADSRLAATYAVLKRDLAKRHAGDRAAYTSGKAAFIAAVLYGAQAGTG